MEIRPVIIDEKFAKFSDTWSPKVIAQMNHIQFKLVRLQGEFVWHEHPDTDETFMVIEGELEIRFKDKSVFLNPGELLVIPKGVSHCPVAQTPCKVMIVEPEGVVNTGDAGGDLTAKNDQWI